MKYPSLVSQRVCTTAIRVYVGTGIDRDGAPARKLVFDGMCNYSEKFRQVISADRQLVELAATALIPGDIAPGRELAGTVEVAGSGGVRTIYRASRARNPDGSVNFVQLELM